jgi:TetR/AcrR family transcriptional regulator, cholesterol catabolism regulator
MTTPQATVEPMGRRDRHRQATRKRILDAALALFLEQGYAATSVDEIAERADVARRTLFNHFARKQDLLAAWVGERRCRLSEMVAEDSAHDRTAAAMLRRQFLMLADMNESDVPLATILVQGWLAEISDLAGVFPVLMFFRDAVVLGQQAGEFTESVSPETIGEMLTSIYIGTLGRWVQPQASGSPAPFVLRDVLLTKLNVVLRGITQSDEPNTPDARESR